MKKEINPTMKVVRVGIKVNRLRELDKGDKRGTIDVDSLTKLVITSILHMLLSPEPRHTRTHAHFLSVSIFFPFPLSLFLQFSVPFLYHFLISIFHSFTLSLFHSFTLSLFHSFTHTQTDTHTHTHAIFLSSHGTLTRVRTLDVVSTVVMFSHTMLNPLFTILNFLQFENLFKIN